MKVRAIFAILIIVFISAVCTITMILRPPPREDIAVYYERLYAPVRTALPAAGRVGYISDFDPRYPNGRAALFLARYSLAPLQVSDDVNEEAIVANFYDLRHLPPILQANRLRIERDFGSGILLLRHERP